MLVFWKERLTFLAVPKTGSTAYEQALGGRADLVVRDPPQLKHAPLYRYNRFFRPMFEKQGASDMETLAVMREPVDWLSSWYRYRRRAFVSGQTNSTLGISFDEFVSAYCDPEPPDFARVGRQSKFLEPRPNGTEVTHLFRYDDQEALNEFLSSRLDTAFELGKHNVSPTAHVRLTPKIEEIVRRTHFEDFVLYASIPDGGLHADSAQTSS